MAVTDAAQREAEVLYETVHQQGPVAPLQRKFMVVRDDVVHGGDGAGLVSDGFEVSLAVNRGHAAGACGRDGLPIDMILDIACGKYARNTGLRSSERQDVASLVERQLIFEQAGIRRMTHGDKDAGARQYGCGTGLQVHEPYAGDDRIAEDPLHDGVPQESDLRVTLRAVLH